MAEPRKSREKGKDRDREKDSEGGDIQERLVAINRVSKTVKGGRRMGFAAIVVVGDGRGRVGQGSGKAREVPEAIKKATDQAKRHMVRVPLREGRTLHHDIEARFGAGRVRLRTAKPGTGIIAGGPLRAVFEVLGIQDVVAKSLGSSNPYNMVKAAFAAFELMESPRMIATRRSKRVNEVLGRKGDAKEEKSDE
jgi:small subunit ribosomal protein S5